MKQTHNYKTTLRWTGDKGTGTSDYKAYDRSHLISIAGKVDLECSSDPAFRGDSTKHNPEELLVTSLSSCHMLWYLHLCAAQGIVVTDYTDEAYATMVENKDGSGQFTEVILHPKVGVTHDHMIEKANSLHHEANSMCFIARSVNFSVSHKPEAFCKPK